MIKIPGEFENVSVYLNLSNYGNFRNPLKKTARYITRITKTRYRLFRWRVDVDNRENIYRLTVFGE